MKLSILGLFATAVYAAVIEVTDKNIQQYLGNNVPTVVSLYAEWCGHCKTFAPQYESLAHEFDHLTDEIQFLRIDGDKNSKISRQFDIKYFPTIMFVDGDKQEEIENRDLKSIKNFIAKKTGLTTDTKSMKGSDISKVSRESEESHVLELLDDTFVDAVSGKNALVSFTAEWCHYCKLLAPEWQKLAKNFGADEDIVIANVDCTEMTPVQNVVETFDVTAYPTIIFFSADPKHGPVLYSGARKYEDFVEYLNKGGVSHRDANGILNENAGLVDEAVLLGANNIDDIIKQVSESKNKHAQVYSTVLNKFREDKTYLEREYDRLSKMLKEELKPADRDTFKIKQNIIASVKKILESDVKSEL